MSYKKMFLFVVLLAMLQSPISEGALSTGGIHNCVATSTGEGYCWGKNDKGQLGVGSLQGAILPKKFGEGLAQVVVNRFHSCALTKEGKIKCWGDNTYGQLGLGVKKSVVGSEAKETFEQLPVVNLSDTEGVQEIKVGLHHSCALFKNGSLKCWGKNGNGELGMGVATSSWGTEANQMGDGLPFLNLGTGKKVLQIALGDKFSCALLDDKTVKCWGSYIASGSGTKQDVGRSAEQMGDALKPVSLGDGAAVSKILAGARSACAVLQDGSMKCWGNHEAGNLGLGVYGMGTIIGDDPEEMGNSLPKVDVGGLSVVDASCGFRHCCAILENKALKCWGENSSGQLGLEDTKNRGEKITEMGSDLPFVNLGDFALVKAVAAASVHTCATLEDDTLRCWGINSFGQLGNNNGASYGALPGSMGDNLPVVPVPK